MKKLLSALMVATIILLSIPICVSADDNIENTDIQVESIEFQDINIFEKANGYYTEIEDIKGQPHTIYKYFFDPSFVVTLKNGKKIESTGWGIFIDDEYYWLSIYDGQTFENQWTVGNSYEVTGTFMDVSNTFTVTINENPIESIEIQDISFIEGTNGYYQEGYDEEGKLQQFYRYDVNNNISYTVTLKNGEKIASNGIDAYIDGDYYFLSISDNQSYNNQWSADNSYEVTGMFMGISDNFTVTITESPIKSIKIDDTTVNVFDGHYSSDWDENGNVRTYYYYDYRPHFTVTLNDGRVFEEQEYNRFLIDGNYYYFTYHDNQTYDNLWLPGNSYEVTGTLMGKSNTFTVTVSNDNPIQSVEIEDTTVYEGIDGYNADYDGEKFFYYNIIPRIKITMKDGKIYYSENYSITIDGKKYYESIYCPELNQGPEKHFEVGKTYNLTGYMFGFSDTFSVTVKENLVKKIAIKKYPKNEYLDGECFDLYGAQLRISYKDGTYEDIDVNAHSDPANGSCEIYSEKFGKWFFVTDYIDYEESTAVIKIMNKMTSMDVFILPNLMEMITLKENEYKQPVITVYNSDGTTYDMIVDYMQVCGCGEDENGLYSEGGILYTDKGNFNYIYEEDANGNCRFGLQIPNSDNYVHSNRVPILKWMQIEKNITYDSAMVSAFFDKQKAYNGIITKDNIDDIIAFAIFHNNFFAEHQINQIKGDDIKQTVYDVFGKKIDLKLSNQYDIETDTYTLDHGFGGTFTSNFDIKYVNGIWESEISYRDEESTCYETVYFEYDENLKIKVFGIGDKTNIIAGDANGNGNLDADDITLLIDSLLANDEYISILDTNSDGNLNILDLVCLKKRILSSNNS